MFRGAATFGMPIEVLIDFQGAEAMLRHLLMLDVLLCLTAAPSAWAADNATAMDCSTLMDKASRGDQLSKKELVIVMSCYSSSRDRPLAPATENSMIAPGLSKDDHLFGYVPNKANNLFEDHAM